MEVIKQKLQAQTATNERVYKGGLHGIRHVFATEGKQGAFVNFLMMIVK